MSIGSLARDVLFTLRQMRRAPAFTASAVLTLAIGIGANTGIFSLLNGYWRPLPVPDADRIVVIASSVSGDEGGLWYRFSYPEVVDYREQSGSVFSDVFAFEIYVGGLTVDGRTTQFVFHPVTGNLFSGLRLVPAAGRLFVPGEGEHTGSEALIVLSHAYWTKRFGGSESAIGRTVRVSGVPARVIGVAPAGFHGLYQGADVEGYVTLSAIRFGRNLRPGSLFTDRGARFLTMLARLKPGVSIAAAQSAVDVVSRRLQAQYPAIEKNVTARVVPEIYARPAPIRVLQSLTPLVRASALGLAALVLLIACMNVANLLFVRATARQREIAVRAALGSGRARLVQLLLVESALLVAAGAAVGLLFAHWSTALFLGSIDPSIELPLNLDFHYDWRVFAYSAAIAMVTGIAIGIVPALRASRTRAGVLLHDGGHASSRGGGSFSIRNLLVVAQVAGSLVLLIVAGLFVRSLQRAQVLDFGFDPANVLSVRLDPRQVGFSRERVIQFYKELQTRLEGLHGVESVAMAMTVPMGYVVDATAVVRDDETRGPDEPGELVGNNTVGPGYFDTLRLPIVAGRAFSEHDTEGSRRVLIVNETMARQFWPGRDAIGKRVRLPRRTGTDAWEVVGVARDSKYVAVFEGPTPHFYVPIEQNLTSWRYVHVRTTVPPTSIAPLVEREIQALDPEMPIADLRTLQQSIAGGFGFLLFRIGAMQASAMGGLGLLLAIVGVYGVVAYGAAQRTREMGIRIALGASPRNVRRLVMRQGLGLVIAGVACGLGASVAVTRLIGRFFVLVSATDAVTFAVVTLVLSGVALTACYLPARRAMRVDPVVALRHQ